MRGLCPRIRLYARSRFRLPYGLTTRRAKAPTRRRRGEDAWALPAHPSVRPLKVSPPLRADDPKGEVRWREQEADAWRALSPSARHRQRCSDPVRRHEAQLPRSTVIAGPRDDHVAEPAESG